MNAFLFGVYTGFSIIGIFGIIVLVYFLAKNNIFFTFVKEGTAKAILTFDRFNRIVISYKKYGLDQEWNIWSIEEAKRQNIILRKEPFRIGGLVWVGIPFIHSVYKYKFEWVSFEQGEEGGELIEKPIPHEDTLDYILLQDDIYYVFVEKAEAKGMVPLNIGTLLTIRITNPYKALFRVQNWLEATQNQLKPVVVSYTGQQGFEELIEDKIQLGDTVHNILKESEIDENVEEDYGVHIKKVGFVKIDPAGERGEKYREASSKAWEAEKEAARLETIYEKITTKGDEGLFIRAIEGLEKASQGAGNTIVFPLAGAKEMIRSWIGEKESKKEGGIIS